MKNAVKTSVIMLALAFSFAAHAQVDPTTSQEYQQNEETKLDANTDGLIQFDKIKIQEDVNKINEIYNKAGNGGSPDISVGDATKVKEDAQSTLDLLSDKKAQTLSNLESAKNHLDCELKDLQTPGLNAECPLDFK